jgi:hypothetical protein
MLQLLQDCDCWVFDLDGKQYMCKGHQAAAGSTPMLECIPAVLQPQLCELIPCSLCL